MTSNGWISIKSEYLPSSDNVVPSLAVQVIRMVDSYMLWIGSTELSQDEVDKAPLQGSLCKDWACAMPPVAGFNPASAPATTLFRSSNSDVAFSMAQRLAKRFEKQIFLSVNIPPAVSSIGENQRLLLNMEKGLVDVLKRMESEYCGDQ